MSKPSARKRHVRRAARTDRIALAFADEAGRLYEHPTLDAAICVGTSPRAAPPGTFRPVPDAGTSANVASLPGRLPVGVDRATGKVEVVESVRMGARSIRPVAVAALFPPGWTRTHLPAYHTRGLSPVLPLYAYAAAGFAGGTLVGAAIRTDRRRHWDPSLYSTPDLDDRIRARIARDPGNRVLDQVARCAHEYRCFTAQNVFYERWEGAIPLSPACNAACVGCISEQDPETGPPPSQWRIAVGPEVDECVRVAASHFAAAGSEAIVSWGQGCEGEPLLRADAIADACRDVRRRTSSGTLHVNTNGSRPEVYAGLREAGLDSVRISLNAAEKTAYEAYYRPTGYGWEAVARGVAEAKRVGLFVSLNLLLFPGFNDRPRQAEALVDLVAAAKPDLIQTRNLSIDPDAYLGCLPPEEGEPIGIETLLRRLVAARPGLKIGNFNVPREAFDEPLLAAELA